MVVGDPARVNSAYAAAGRRDAGATDAVEACGLMTQPLFAPLAEWVASFPVGRCGDLAQLDALLSAVEPRPCTRSGHPIRCVSPADLRVGYEARIHATGEVVTRPANWHDFFNVLVWMRFPRTKAELNALHVAEMSKASSTLGRGALRDAATQFDESGIVVLASDPTLFDLLEARRWHELFWRRRGDVLVSMRFLVFGHGLYDALRAPFYRMCGRAALIPADATVISGDMAAQCRYADTILAERFAARTCYPRPKSLLALPLLGIPGVCAENQRGDYYLDPVQFRPPPGDR